MPVIVSVICTFLNAESTLEATLASLQRQSVERAEFILVDDGSTDGSLAIAERFRAADRRFAIFSNPRPGRGEALNLGVDRANSDRIAVLDADDVVHPEWLKDGVGLLQERNEYAVISFERIYIEASTKVEWQDEGVIRPVVRDVTLELARANVIPHSGALIRKADLVSVGRYDASRQSLFDYDLWIRLAKAGRRAGICNLVRVGKRYHPGQKFANRKGYLIAAWREQYRAIIIVDRSYRNFVWLALRVAADVTRDARRAITSGIGLR